MAADFGRGPRRIHNLGKGKLTYVHDNRPGRGSARGVGTEEEAVMSTHDQQPPLPRETRRLPLLVSRSSADWPAVVQAAYDAVREVVGDVDVRPVEPWGEGPEGFEWRVYGHDSTSLTTLTAYVPIIRTDNEEES